MPFGASYATKADDAKAPPGGIIAVAVIIPVLVLAGCLAVYYDQKRREVFYNEKRTENVYASSMNDTPMNPVGEGRRCSI